MDRAILHCDCNSFFASVEAMLDPSLRGKPVAVAGDPKDRHGVVVAASWQAKQFGVRTTDSVYAALRKCPQLIVVPPHHDRYEEVSRIINSIYLQYTDLVDPFSVDESFLDVTHSPYYDGGSLQPLADELRRRVREEVGVTISVGGSFNRCFAKLASEMKKPDGTTVLPREAMQSVIWQLPARDMLYVQKHRRAAGGHGYQYHRRHCPRRARCADCRAGQARCLPLGQCKRAGQRACAQLLCAARN